MSRRTSSKTVCTAPMAVTSAGDVVVNAVQLTMEDGLASAVEAAEKTGLPVFVGVLVPTAKLKRLLHDIDDAAADVSGRLGANLVHSRRR
jgi:hypothetical protein